MGYRLIEHWTADGICVGRCAPKRRYMYVHPQDECFALRGVVGQLAAILGVDVLTLLSPFSVSLDVDATLLALSCMV